MSEFRKDIVTDQWVIIASERGMRPSEFHVSIEKNKKEQCPFCIGYEYLTPAPVLQLDNAVSKQWQVRVVPNKFPALNQTGDDTFSNNGIYENMAGFGTHEVIIETPLHSERMADFGREHLALVLRAYRLRLTALSKDRKNKFILLFKNYGHQAGSSLEHSHSQMITTPILPITIKNKLNGSIEYYKKHKRCVYCHIIDFEKQEQKRVIDENKDFLAYAPYASRVPYEICILPKRHQHRFDQINDEQLESLAAILKNTLKSFDLAIENPPFNMILHTSPKYDKTKKYYHWHIEIMPKLSTLAGFELGSGFFINTTPPEMAASHLRQYVTR